MAPFGGPEQVLVMSGPRGSLGSIFQAEPGRVFHLGIRCPPLLAGRGGTQASVDHEPCHGTGRGRFPARGSADAAVTCRTGPRRPRSVTFPQDLSVTVRPVITTIRCHGRLGGRACRALSSITRRSRPTWAAVTCDV